MTLRTNEEIFGYLAGHFTSRLPLTCTAWSAGGYNSLVLQGSLVPFDIGLAAN